MKFSQIIAYLALGATAAYALPTEAVENTADVADFDAADFGVEDFNYEAEGDIEARANLPGLNALQSKYARAIIAQAKKDKVGAHGCQAGIATAMVEVRPFPNPSHKSIMNDSNTHSTVYSGHVRQQESPGVYEVPPRPRRQRPRLCRSLPAACLHLQKRQVLYDS